MSNSFLRPPSKLPHVGASIFSAMSQLAASCDAINLSQGFPDFDCDPKLVELVTKYMRLGHNQYAPMPGVASLRERISEKTAEQHQAYYHPESEVTITAGATQAIFTAVGAIVGHGDEALIFDPAYDAYEPAIRAFGGTATRVALHAPTFKIDWEGVAQLLTPKTKLIIINNPTNPSARLLTEADLSALAGIVRGTSICIISDEVYEHIIFDGRSHASAAQHPELRQRTFVMASFGKLFHTTGWKIGYCLAPADLTTEFRKLHQFNVFSVNTPVQYALADYLTDKESYLSLNTFFQEKRDLLVHALAGTPFKPLPCEGTYFLLVNYEAVSQLPEGLFCTELAKQYGVATIPVSAFYDGGHEQSLARICFAKTTETLNRAIERLAKVAEITVK